MANLFDFPNLTGGFDNVFGQLAQQTILFPIMFLVFIFVVIFFSGTTSQIYRRGDADFPLWALVSFLTIDLIALLMTLSETQIINIQVLSICLGGTFLVAFWFFMSRGRFEN